MTDVVTVEVVIKSSKKPASKRKRQTREERRGDVRVFVRANRRRLCIDANCRSSFSPLKGFPLLDHANLFFPLVLLPANF